MENLLDLDIHFLDVLLFEDESEICCEDTSALRFLFDRLDVIPAIRGLVVLYLAVKGTVSLGWGQFSCDRSSERVFGQLDCRIRRRSQFAGGGASDNLLEINHGI